MKLKLLQLDKEYLFNWYDGLITSSISKLDGKKLTDGKLELYKLELLKQYYIYFSSIKTLYPGLKVMYRGKENEITASASILVLIRACLENYSMFYYIYRHESSNDKIYFRFWSWFREGLMYRQKIETKYFIEKKNKEQSQIDEITNELKSHGEFADFTDKQQVRFLDDGKWYFMGVNKLLELSGFSRNLSINCYNYFSMYAHARSSSIMQTSQATFNDSKQITDSMTNALFIATGLYLFNFNEIFNEINLFENTKDQDFVLSWCKLGKDLLN